MHPCYIQCWQILFLHRRWHGSHYSYLQWIWRTAFKFSRSLYAFQWSLFIWQNWMNFIYVKREKLVFMHGVVRPTFFYFKFRIFLLQDQFAASQGYSRNISETFFYVVSLLGPVHEIYTKSIIYTYIYIYIYIRKKSAAERKTEFNISSPW